MLWTGKGNSFVHQVDFLHRQGAQGHGGKKHLQKTQPSSARRASEEGYVHMYQGLLAAGESDGQDTKMRSIGVSLFSYYMFRCAGAGRQQWGLSSERAPFSL